MAADGAILKGRACEEGSKMLDSSRVGQAFYLTEWAWLPSLTGPLGDLPPKDTWNQQAFHVLLRGSLRFFVLGNSSPSNPVNQTPWSGDCPDDPELLPHMTTL